MSEPVSVFAELEDLLAAARRLPDCDGAAKLHALVTRVTDALGNGGNVVPAAEALASAATASLANDPWVQFEVAARAFREHAAGAAPIRPVEQPANHALR